MDRGAVAHVQLGIGAARRDVVDLRNGHSANLPVGLHRDSIGVGRGVGNRSPCCRLRTLVTRRCRASTPSSRLA